MKIYDPVKHLSVNISVNFLASSPNRFLFWWILIHTCDERQNSLNTSGPMSKGDIKFSPFNVMGRRCLGAGIIFNQSYQHQYCDFAFKFGRSNKFII